MINDEANNYYYFATKNLAELNSLGLLRGKKEELTTTTTIIIVSIKTIFKMPCINNNDFQNALDDGLSYQLLNETHKEYQN